MSKAIVNKEKLNKVIFVDDFGAVGDGITDDLAAFDSALAATANGGEILLTPGKSYSLSAVWAFSPTSIRITVRGYGATIIANHTGDCIDLTATNEAYGAHILEGFSIVGPNVAYPGSALELAGTSTGAGIKMGSSADTTNAAAGYNTTVRDVVIRNFLYGIYMRAALLGKSYGLILRTNQYGIYVDGGMVNANDFFGCTIRENRVAGVYSAGTTGGSLTNATQNRFYGGIIESNIPYRGDNPAGYSGGYRTARDLLLAENGHGVVLLNSYDWLFHGTYFENHNFDVWLGSSSDGNDFIATRHGNGNNGRVGGVMFSGAGVINNKFANAQQISANATDVTVVSDHADHSSNQFLDTEGFNFILANLTGFPYIRNNKLNQAGGGTPYGALAIPSNGSTTATAGTGAGQIDGIGTASATLNVKGLGVIILGTAITGATTIDLFDNLTPNSMLVLLCQQATYDVTIKSGAFSNAVDIICKSATDAVLTEQGHAIVFWINALSQAIEIGRNF